MVEPTALSSLTDSVEVFQATGTNLNTLSEITGLDVSAGTYKQVNVIDTGTYNALFIVPMDSGGTPWDIQQLGSDALSNSNNEVVVGGMNYLFNGTTWDRMRNDGETYALQTIDYEHHETHAGNHFFYTDSVTLGAAATQDYMITTPNTTKWAHFTFRGTGSAITTVQLYEAGDRTGTTGQTILNSDRNSATVSGLTIHKGTSGGTTDGTMIYTLSSGSSTAQSRQPMAAERGNEIILKQNTKYILRITSGTASNLTNVYFAWYEHTNI